MKNVLKNPLKLIVAGMFAVAMGFGMFMSLEVSESKGSKLDLLSFSTSAVAQGEDSSKKYDVTCKSWGYVCTPDGSKECNDDDC